MMLSEEQEGSLAVHCHDGKVEFIVKLPIKE